MLRVSDFQNFWGISRSLIGLQYGVLRSVIFGGPNCPFSDKKRGLLMGVFF